MKEMLTLSVFVSAIVFALSFAFLGGLATTNAYTLMNIALASVVISIPLAFLMVSSSLFLSRPTPRYRQQDEATDETSNQIDFELRPGVGVFHAKKKDLHGISMMSDKSKDEPEPTAKKQSPMPSRIS